MENKKIKAAVVGLGKAGSRFDEESRTAIWSHVGALLFLEEIYDLVATVDIDSGNRKVFKKRCPTIPVYNDIVKMMKNHEIDILTLATPHYSREKVFDEIVKYGNMPRLIVFEKPLADSAEVRNKIINKSRETKTEILVNYNRRYSLLYKKMLDVINRGDIGKSYSITIKSANRIWSLGSHAINLLLFLAQEMPVRNSSFRLPYFDEEGEAAFDYTCTFPSGLVGRVLTVGFKKNLIFEVDVVGSEGRLIALNNGKDLFMSKFMPSQQYAGYLIEKTHYKIFTEPADHSTFVAICKEAADVLIDGVIPSSNGDSASSSESIIDMFNKNEEL